MKKVLEMPLSGASVAGESIYQALVRLGLSSSQTRKILATRTRDREDLMVYRDTASGVIFIDEHYVGNEEYESGDYRRELEGGSETQPAPPNFEDRADTRRRINNYEQFFVGKDVCDFGCGAGSFLTAAQPLAASVCGIELQKDFIAQLELKNIPAFNSLAHSNRKFDTIFMFHSLEHFAEPAKILRDIRSALKPGGQGKVVIEVPHARDFLLDGLSCEEFLQFTLWSQHLILHTRESLSAFLADAGFQVPVIEGVQRFGLANHLNWIRNKAPGGHRANLSVMETPALKSAYADALSRLDANDTLVAIASS